METTQMPKTKAEPKERIDLYLPKPLLREVEKIAELDGWTTGELYRLLIVDGLAAYAEKSNKRLVNQQLRDKLGLGVDDGDQSREINETKNQNG